jgi:uncharacterized membrane protein
MQSTYRDYASLCENLQIYSNKYAYTGGLAQILTLKITCLVPLTLPVNIFYSTEVSVALVELLLLLAEAAVISPA